MNSTGYIKIWSDKWDDVGKIYRVLSYYKPDNTTACQVELQHQSGKIEQRVIPFHEIEWISDGDW